MKAKSTLLGKTLVVWRIVDGKPGHEEQSEGLVRALRGQHPLESYDIPALTGWGGWVAWFRCVFPQGALLPKPDLILGVGHRTHASLLAAKRAFGGKTVVLMQPSLPLGLFDLCLIPEHDRPKDRPNVERTYGVLNTVRRAPNAAADRGLFLIGGPSAHHSWDEATTIEQIVSIVGRDRQIQWTLTTSRRTPESTEAALLVLKERNLEVVPFAQTKRGWVAARLQECGLAWVSEDSVSMVFEALSSGASVGVLEVPKKKQGSRVARLIQGVVEAGYAARFGEQLSVSDDLRPEFSEAKRCAELVLRLFPSPAVETTKDAKRAKINAS